MSAHFLHVASQIGFATVLIGAARLLWQMFREDFPAIEAALFYQREGESDA